MKTLVAIQARTGSTRLPGKVLLPLGEAPALLQMVRRVRRAKQAPWIAVLTTELPEDDAIASLCLQENILCFRGHPTDCLDRHYRAAAAFGAEAIAKIPSDCPLIDPQVIDTVLEEFQRKPAAWDYVSNLQPPTHPDGNDVEVMTVSALTDAWRESRDSVEREHTTPFLWRRPQRFRLRNVVWETGLDFSQSHRLTLDHPEDYALICRVHESLSRRVPEYGLVDILTFLEQHPDVHGLNDRWKGDFWYRRQHFTGGAM